MAIKPTDCVLYLKPKTVIVNGEQVDVVYPRFWSKFMQHVDEEVKKALSEARKTARPYPGVTQQANQTYDLKSKIERDLMAQYRVVRKYDKKYREYLKFETHADLSYFVMIWG